MDNTLYRPLHHGQQFEHLMPYSACKGLDSGTGNTDHSIIEMVKVVEKYSWHMREIAPLLEKSNLQATIATIHQFWYNHFQYLADGDEQKLRSPACSWKQRHQGIDCKSYSIGVSCTLTELKINHFIRKVNYTTTPEAYSHVYVIVPNDQKNNDIQGGYFIIDATLKNNNEINFVKSKDQIMLNHTTLARPHTPQLGNPEDSINTESVFSVGQAIATGDVGGAIATVREMLPKIGLMDLLKPAEVMNKIKDWLNRLSCIGGSMMNANDLKETQQTVGSYFLTLLNEINDAAADGRLEDVSELVAQYQGHAILAKRCYFFRTGDGFNFCSRESLYAMQQMCACYEHIGNFLNDWIKTNYVSKFQVVNTYTMHDLYNLGYFPYVNGTTNHYWNIEKLHLIEKMGTIKAFEITQKIKDGFPTLYTLDAMLEVNYIADLAFDATLIRPIAINKPKPTTTNTNTGGGSNTNPTGGGSNTNTNTSGGTPPPPKAPDKAGFPLVPALIIGAIGIGIAMNKSKK